MNWRVLLRRPAQAVALRPSTSAPGSSKEGDRVVTVKVEAADPLPAPPGNPYQPATAQLRDVAKWLIAAFAAVATVMLAGTQLSSLGELSTDHPTRLVLALVGATVVVLATAASIYLLSTVLAFDVSGMQGLQAASREQPMRGMVEADVGMRAGRSSVAHLLDDYQKARAAQRIAMVLRSGLQHEMADFDQPPADLVARLAHARRLEEVADADIKALRGSVHSLIQLKGYLVVRRQFDAVRGRVMWLALLAAAGIITFAWAANPPDAKVGAAAVQEPAPVEARLVLTAVGEQDLAVAIGADCAKAARASGVKVIALAASAQSSEVVLLVDGPCTTPARLTVENRLGRLVPVDAVVVPTPTTTTT